MFLFASCAILFAPILLLTKHAIFVSCPGFFHVWMKFISEAGPDSPALNITEIFADLHYPVGPPYMGTVRDMYRIVNRWAELVPLVHAAKPQLLAEMCKCFRTE